MRPKEKNFWPKNVQLMESNPRPPLGHETAAQTLSSVMDRGVAGHADVDDDDVGAGVYNDVELKDILNGKN